MHAGRNYTLKEVLLWTKREILMISLISTVPVVLFSVLGWTWVVIPWVPIALVGTAVAFVVGFKNNASYDRTWEARTAWGAIVNASRSWGFMSRDYVSDMFLTSEGIDLTEARRTLIYRHLAWVTALRYQLRQPRAWESVDLIDTQEYRARWYEIEERVTPLSTALAPFLSGEDIDRVMASPNAALTILSDQSAHLSLLRQQGAIEDFRHMEMQNGVNELLSQQGACERIKNFPYPRQFATLNEYFVRIFVLMVPFGMLQEFEKLGDHMVWLTIPFSALVSWIFVMMEKIGTATESPFEGSANDVPITALSRTIEIDLRGILGEDVLPGAKQPSHHILM
ncbi:MAG TPA: bestrophin family ion channel [Candidatus Didemnitutus sp.]|nr:bestrophin family ion channel [Candidatus Didemnitutus sp.]